MNNFNVSDWVHGRTGEGEMVYGFVKSMDLLQGLVELHVVKSDNGERIGRSATVKRSTVKQVQDTVPTDPRQAAELIDLALATWDREWFMELTEIRGDAAQGEQSTVATVPPTSPTNRLGKFIR